MIGQIKKWEVEFPELTITPVLSEKQIDFFNLDEVLILFHATWSGPSILGLSWILKKVKESKPSLKIFVIDIDTLSLDFIKSILGHKSHGYGEALYLLKGKPIAKYCDQLNRTELENFAEKMK